MTLYPRSHGRASAERARPIADLRGIDGLGRPPQHDRPRPAHRPARVPPLLGGRAPRHADARLREPRGPDRPDRRGHRAHPRGQRRGDAAPLQPAQRGGALQHPERPLPRAYRPRHRPGAGHRPADDARAPARPPAAVPRRLPRPAHRAARLPRGPHARGPSVRPPLGLAARRAASAPRSGCWAPRPRARSGPASWASPTRSPTSSTRGERRSRPSTGAASRRAAAARPARGRRGGRGLRRHGRGGRAAGGERPHVLLAAAHGPARSRCRRSRRRCATSRRARRRPSSRRALIGSPDGSGRDSRPSRASTAPRR